MSDKVVSVARIWLPFTVQSHVDTEKNIAFTDDIYCLVYIDLRPVWDKYAIVNDLS